MEEKSEITVRSYKKDLGKLTGFATRTGASMLYGATTTTNGLGRFTPRPLGRFGGGRGSLHGRWAPTVQRRSSIALATERSYFYVEPAVLSTINLQFALAT